MLPLLGVVGAAVLMALGNASDNNAMFLLASVLLVVFGTMYFKR